MDRNCISCENVKLKMSKDFYCWYECGIDAYTPCQYAGTEDYYEPRKGIRKIWNNILTMVCDRSEK